MLRHYWVRTAHDCASYLEERIGRAGEVTRTVTAVEAYAPLLSRWMASAERELGTRGSVRTKPPVRMVIVIRTRKTIAMTVATSVILGKVSRCETASAMSRTSDRRSSPIGEHPQQLARQL